MQISAKCHIIFAMSKEKNNNMCDYVLWRGDLPFSESPFNEVDAMIFSQLSYLHFDGLISDNIKDKIKLSELSRLFMESPDFETRKQNGPLINEDTVSLLGIAGNSIRFGQCELCAFVDKVDVAQEEQFSALSVFLDDDTVFIAYRGTHEEIIGWKEDLNMAFETPVPAQIEAVKYLEMIAGSTNRKIRTGGHSKGGNLALYAAAFCEKSAKKKILRVYNNDGQGFDEKILESAEYMEIQDRIQTILPQNSMVGILLPHKGQIRIVESSNSSLMQHDGFSWEVLGTSFVTVEERSPQSLFFEKAVQEWLERLDTNRKREAINTLFDIIGVSGASTLTEFQENWFKSSPKIIKYLKEIDRQKKKDMNDFFKIFIESEKYSLLHKIEKL